VGGQPARAQKDALGRGVHVAVGTPGRVLDLLQKRALAPGVIATVVLDEADRMLDMGFGTEVEEILRSLPRTRQTALFSATFPDTIAEMSRKYQRDAVRVTIDEAADSALEIRELKLATSPKEKFHALCWLLNENPHDSALIFCNFKATAVEIASRLASAGVSVGRLDGDLDQFQRDQVLARFRNESVRLLVATDVAGRGIDVKDLDLVINYEFPQHADIYVHRIGRTGRAGKKGVAISLTNDRSGARIDSIEGETGRKIEAIERRDKNAPGAEVLLRSIAQSATMETILISGGRKDKIRPGDILGALTGEAGGLKGDDVGKIEIHDRLSYVAVTRSVCQTAVDRLNAGRIKGKRFRATQVDGRWADVKPGRPKCDDR
jgi:ATP-independent RNA helicase DbpA